MDTIDRNEIDETMEQVREGFWPKVRRTLGRVPFVPDAVAMYYAMLDLRTPFWVKGVLATALLYFIMPLDTVPDFLSVAGYADDATLLFMTLKLVADHVRPEHLDHARTALDLPDDLAAVGVNWDREDNEDPFIARGLDRLAERSGGIEVDLPPDDDLFEEA